MDKHRMSQVRTKYGNRWSKNKEETVLMCAHFGRNDQFLSHFGKFLGHHMGRRGFKIQMNLAVIIC